MPGIRRHMNRSKRALMFVWMSAFNTAVHYTSSLRPLAIRPCLSAVKTSSAFIFLYHHSNFSERRIEINRILLLPEMDPNFIYFGTTYAREMEGQRNVTGGYDTNIKGSIGISRFP